MCNLSTGVYSKGYDTGISEGEMKKARETAYKLQDMGMPLEKIADIIEVGMDTLQKWLVVRKE